MRDCVKRSKATFIVRTPPVFIESALNAFQIDRKWFVVVVSGSLNWTSFKGFGINPCVQSVVEPGNGIPDAYNVWSIDPEGPRDDSKLVS